MEKDLFGESSVEEDSSDDEFSKPVSRDTTATAMGVDKSESGGSSSSPTSSDVGDNSVSGDDGDGSVSGKGGDNSVSGDEGVSGDDGDDNSVSGDVGDKSVSGDEGATPPPADDSQFPSTQDLFGTQSSSDSSDSEAEQKNTTTPTIDEDEQSKITKGIFGELADMSSSDDDDDGGVSQRREQVESTEQEGVAITEEVPRIDVEIPRCLAKLGTDQYFVKLPNFLSVDTRPFDASIYEDEMEEEGEFLDEDGRARLKLKVENTIRWRKKTNSEGIEEKETNARIVQWTDGSMSLYLGSEIFDIHKQPLHGEYSHLFVRQGTGLQGQAVFKSKLTFRPHSTDSQTHRKMTLSIADRFSKAHQKIRVLPVVDMNPESRRSEMIKQEEQRLRACMKMDSQQRRKKEKQASKELTSSYLQPKGYDDYDDEEGVSISAIKTSVKSKSRSRKDSFIDDDSDGIGGIDGEQDIVDDDEEEEEEEEMEEGSTEKTKENSRKRQSSQEVATVKAKGRKLVFDDDDSD